MEYYTLKEKLILPEYGRNIQQMVKHALTIEDKTERTRCVHSIIAIMGKLFPHLRDVNDFKHKLWDHLAVMSDFKLDIDYPYEVPKLEILNTKPDRVPYPISSIRYRHYGKTVQAMVNKALEFPEGDDKNRLIELIANYMKKSYLTWNKEVDDEKIYDDLKELSHGIFSYTSESLKLKESKDILAHNKVTKVRPTLTYKNKKK
ncbi:MAG: DUF4290 domain-containing protein [Paludibacteraceae bacterium]|nr:DUF4290 domain-containing protein [Paludibacteraceae bacterium]MBP6284816.1 DUF4290 domain-containing protein [Paludibacteraceae bacterium]